MRASAQLPCFVIAVRSAVCPSNIKLPALCVLRPPVDQRGLDAQPSMNEAIRATANTAKARLKSNTRHELGPNLFKLAAESLKFIKDLQRDQPKLHHVYFPYCHLFCM